MRAWHRISHSDTPHIRQELVKGHYNVYTGILETCQTTPEILEDAIHSPPRILSHLPQRCPSPKDITPLNQLTPPLGLQLTATSWPRQPSTRLPSLLCLTMGLTLPTLRRSQVPTNLRMLMVTVILNFKNLERAQSSFWSSFLEKIRTIYTFFLYAQHFLSVHNIIIELVISRRIWRINDVNIYFQILRSLGNLNFTFWVSFDDQAYAAIRKKVMLSSVPRISGVFMSESYM